jgi:2'-5' RNA ligase
MARLLRIRWRDQQAARRQEAILRQIWENFQRYPTVIDGRHDTEAWRSRGGDFVGCVIRIPAATIEPQLSDLREALSPLPHVREHPDHFLHLMLQELGFLTDAVPGRDEVTVSRIEEFVNAASAALSTASPYELRLGGTNAFRDSIFLDVHDRGETSKIHSRVHELAGIPTLSPYAYLPQVTVAHFEQDMPMGEIAKTLSEFRNLHFGSLRVSEIEVVKMRVDEAYPIMEAVATIDLGAQAVAEAAGSKLG